MGRRVLLVLPTHTYRARAFLEAARRLQVEVVIASEERSTLGRLHPERELVIDLGRGGGERARADGLAGVGPVDAVVGVDEASVLAAAELASLLGLPGNPEQAVAATRNKALLRQRLTEAGLPQPIWRLWPAGTAPTLSSWPAVVKPVDQAASRGVVRVDDQTQLLAAGELVRGLLGADPGCAQTAVALVVEEYVPGPEIAVEALLRDGQLLRLAIYDKPDPLEGPYFEETIYSLPSRLGAGKADAVWEILQRATGALGLLHGPVHAEFRLGGPNPILIDLASRSIGGRCSGVLRFRGGTTLEELILGNALGDPLPPLELEEEGAAVMMLPVPGAGRLLWVEGAEAARAVPGVTALEITVPVGGRVAPAPVGDRYLGFLFARGETAEAAVEALRRAHRELHVQIGD